MTFFQSTKTKTYENNPKNQFAKFTIVEEIEI